MRQVEHRFDVARQHAKVIGKSKIVSFLMRLGLLRHTRLGFKEGLRYVVIPFIVTNGCSPHVSLSTTLVRPESSRGQTRRG